MLRNDFEGIKKSVLKALEAVCPIRSGDNDGHDADDGDLMAMKNAGSSSSFDALLKHAASARGRYFILKGKRAGREGCHTRVHRKTNLSMYILSQWEGLKFWWINGEWLETLCQQCMMSADYYWNSVKMGIVQVTMQRKDGREEKRCSVWSANLGKFYAQAAAIGVAGGHPVIKKLMSSDNEDLMEVC